MPQLFILNPGNWIIEDDDIPGNNRSRIRNFDTGTFQDFTHAADSITFLAGAANVNLTVDFGDGLGAAGFTVGSLTDGSQSPNFIDIRNVETTGRVTLAARTIGEGDPDAAPDIVAGELAMSAFLGIGEPANAIETQVSRLEAETEFEGINIANTGTVTIGGLVNEIDGLHGSPTARDVVLTNAGSILLDVPTPGAPWPTVYTGRFGTIRLTALGADSDLTSIANYDSIAGDGPAELRAGRDIVFGTGGQDNLVKAEGGLTLEAGRDVVIDGQAGLSTAFGGDMSVTAGRNLSFLGSGVAVANGVMRLATGPGGTASFTGFNFIVASGDLFVNADRMVINMNVQSQLGAVNLAPASAGRGVIVGSATDTAPALELSDAELDRVVAATDLIIGSHDAGRVQLTSLVGIQSTPDVIIRSGTNIDISGLFLVSGDLTLSARDHVREFPTGAVGGDTLTVLVDSVDDDPGIGGNAFLAISTGSTSTTIRGNLDADTLNGTSGPDMLLGEGGNDAIRGNAGNDRLDGGAGTDSMFGGSGDDWLIIRDASDLVFETGGEGNDRVFAYVDWTLGAGQSVETLSTFNDALTDPIDLTGNALTQTIYGNAGANILDSGGGLDALAGLGGDDWYVIRSGAEAVFENAGAGNDRVFAYVSYGLSAGAVVETLSTYNAGTSEAIDLTGNDFNQTVYGNAGANRLDGKGGIDVLFGDAGADLYAFTSALGMNNIDTIVGFQVGVDKIGFAGVTPAQLLAGGFRTGTSAQDADDRIIYNPATGALFYDGDGNGAGAQMQFATLAGAPPLSASDFAMI